MTNQPQPAPTFQPVFAVPIVVLPTPKGLRVVRTADGLYAGATFREALEAAQAPKE